MARKDLMTQPRKTVRRQRANDPREVRLAGEVQKLLLPKSPPSCSWCCMAVRNRMANVLGGDFYDFIELGNGRQLLFLGDVTGHGLHASMVMSLVYGFIHRAARGSCRPGAVVTDLNRFLRHFAQRSERLDHFFSTTLFFAAIDPASMKMHYVNAGHPAALVRRAGRLLRLPATSHPVGYFDEIVFTAKRFQLQTGDRLLLYTDGLIDSSNSCGQMYGAERLIEAFHRIEDDPPVFLQWLFADIDDYLAGQAPFDDCSAIVADFQGLMRGGEMT